MLRCSKCDNPIPKERIEFFLDNKGGLPETCVKCSSEQKNVGFMTYAHKTAGETTIVNVNLPNGREQLRQAERAHRRAR